MLLLLIKSNVFSDLCLYYFDEGDPQLGEERDEWGRRERFNDHKNSSRFSQINPWATRCGETEFWCWLSRSVPLNPLLACALPLILSCLLSKKVLIGNRKLLLRTITILSKQLTKGPPEHTVRVKKQIKHKKDKIWVKDECSPIPYYKTLEILDYSRHLTNVKILKKIALWVCRPITLKKGWGLCPL